MKSLTIKKVALGIFLAGYAASGAFAASLTATTQRSIQGNAPALSEPGTDPITGTATNTIKVEIVNSTIPAQVGRIGDVLKFTFATVDKDGDTPATPAMNSEGSEGTFRVLYFKSGAWVEADSDSYEYVGNGEIKFTLGNDAGGATKIGYKIAAKTQYGDPRIGNWLYGPTLGSTAPNVNPDDPQTNPGNTGGVGDNGVDGPFNPIPGSSSKYAIFKVDGTTFPVANNYSKQDINPKLGETYKLVYWDDADNDDGVTTGETVLVPSDIKWYVTGGNSAANGSSPAASDIELVGQTSETIELPALNSGVTSWFATAPEAGVQGFKLKVTFN